MIRSTFIAPLPLNEPVLSYAPGSPERFALKAALHDAKSIEHDIPMVINGRDVRTGLTVKMHPPHELKHTIGVYHKGTKDHVEQAIEAALTAKSSWENMPIESRAAIFLKAAELLSTKYRARINAATMLCQSKNAYQAEIDSACELIDFLRFNVHFASQLYAMQPYSAKGFWNSSEYRALEGFVFALTPFNFTAISGNLPTSAALMGNVVVWKPAFSQIFSAFVIMDILREAGLPDGVINLIYTDGPTSGDVIFNHQDFAGIHFTGSTSTFNRIWKTVGDNLSKYKTYPRLVGETGGKDFVIAHPSADVDALITALTRGAFEYQGQKCSAASRAYVPNSLWPSVKDGLMKDITSFKMGVVDDFRNFINAVIDEVSFDKIVSYIEQAKKSPDAEIVVGGTYDKSQGYFISPTVILAKKPDYITLCEEIFGPVLTVYVYSDDEFEKTLEILNNTSPFALTGSIFSQNKHALELATVKLRHSAGNFYINDKPTGAVVGQQPFGGGRLSGTNDKAGSIFNLIRWTSIRTIKETFVPTVDYRYPFMEAE